MNTGVAAAEPAVFNEQACIQVGKWLQAAGYCFVTVTPATHARVAARQRNGEARSLRDIFGWSMPFRPSLLPPPVLASLKESGALAAQGDGLLRCAVRFSTLGSCLYMHSAYPTSNADAVFFGPDTYRFAALIQNTLAATPGARASCVVDVGCGAGAGGIVAARALQQPPSQLILADINPAALRYAGVNVALAGLPPASLRESDLFAGIGEPIDLLVANPPYLHDPQARLYRHGGGELGSDLSVRIVAEGLPRLAAGGTLVLYTGAAMVGGRDSLREAVEAIMRDADMRYDYAELDPDVFGEELEFPAYSRVERIAAVALVVRNLPRSGKTAR